MGGQTATIGGPSYLYKKLTETVGLLGRLRETSWVLGGTRSSRCAGTSCRLRKR